MHGLPPALSGQRRPPTDGAPRSATPWLSLAPYRCNAGGAWTATGGVNRRRPETEGGGIVYARSTTVLAKRESIDAGIAHIRDVVLPALQRMDGCRRPVPAGRPRLRSLHRDQLVGIQGRDAGGRRAGRRDS